MPAIGIGTIVSVLGALAVAGSLGVFSYRSLDLLEQADFRARQLSSPASPPPPKPPPVSYTHLRAHET